jgi:hypothetical protein
VHIEAIHPPSITPATTSQCDTRRISNRRRFRTHDCTGFARRRPASSLGSTALSAVVLSSRRSGFASRREHCSAA